jgi:general transcription factor 3C polypeptide 5 (transcription factor C subunit 1)
MLKHMIEDSNDLRETCHVRGKLIFTFTRQSADADKERDGWYSTHALEQIKTILRHKFFSLLEGHAATDEECAALLNSGEGSAKLPTTRNQKLRAGKHNMAKGALRPEDAAVSCFFPPYISWTLSFVSSRL